jgi:hypothetical protein
MSGLMNNADSFFALAVAVVPRPGPDPGASRDGRCGGGEGEEDDVNVNVNGLDDVCFGECSMISGIFIRCSSSSSGVKSSSILVHMLSS